MKKRIASLLMAMAMAVGMIVPASAADATGKLVIDGKTYTGSNAVELIQVGESDIDKVTVTSGEAVNVYDANNCKAGVTATIGANKTGYKIYSKTTDGYRHVMFELTTALKDEITVDVTEAVMYYQYYFNSGFYNTNNNLGGSSTCTSEVVVDSKDLDYDQKVKGGAPISVVFTPDAGQDIVKLNIRAEYADAASNLVDVPTSGSKSVTVAGQSFQLKNSGGKVTVSYTASRDMYITALTQDVKEKFNLNVSTDGNCTANTSNKVVVSGDTASVTFTPVSGYTVGDITITAGGKNGTISPKNSSVTVDGKSYTVSRNLNGTATLSIPAMTTDVSVRANGTTDAFYISVSSGRYADSAQDGTTFVSRYDSFTVTFTADDNAILETLTIKTPNGTYTASVNDLYILVDGGYYRMYTNYAGDLTVYLNNISSNMEISVRGKETAHSVKLRSDNGCEPSDKTSYVVDDGEDLEVSFTPTKSKYTIDELKVNYDGTTYTADPTDDSYIRVNGVRWPITVSRDGTVTLRMSNIEYDVTVTANTDYTASGSYRITKSEGSHSTITYTGNNPFDEDDSSTVTVTTDKKYIISTIKVAVGSKSTTIKPFENTVTVGKNTYKVTWVDNTEAKIYLNGFTGNVTITTTAKKGDVEKPSISESTYHSAYMFGIGNGQFAPENVLTRAEAVTLLCRAVDNMSDFTVASYAYNINYYDVQPGSWYTGYVNYARSKGYLSVLSNGLYFFPEQAITRAEYLALLCEFKGIDVSKASTSTNYWDVSSYHWAARYIRYATDNGWVQGTGSSYFNPDRSVSRAEIATMTNHILDRVPDNTVVMTQFTDVPYGHWAYYEIAEAAISHYIGGFNGDAEIWSYKL